MNVALLHQLEPRMNPRTDEKEPLRTYCRRIRPLLPHFPTSAVVQWLYRHHEDVAFQYGWLDLSNLRFQKQMWSTKRLISSVRAYEEEIVENLAQSAVRRDSHRSFSPRASHASVGYLASAHHGLGQDRHSSAARPRAHGALSSPRRPPQKRLPPRVA